MPALPPRPDLDQLRRQARDLQRAARAGDAAALVRVHAVAPAPTLAAAQLALAREHGFASWPRLVVEVRRRALLDGGDAAQLAAFLAEAPELAVADLERWSDHPLGAPPLGYVAMLRYNTADDTWRDVPGTAAMARVLLAAGAPVDGEPGDTETPLITAASYGDAEVARVLIEAGADLEARSSADAGGVPGATALVHAAVFGMTAVVDVLVAAGARVEGGTMAAAVGDVALLDLHAPDADRLAALVMAADHQRLAVIDALVTAGAPVDTADPTWHRHPLRLAAANGRPASVRHLLALVADPAGRDDQGRTPLDLCRAAAPLHPGNAGHAAVEALLATR